MPKIAKCKIRSVSPYSQSRYHQTEKKDKESHDDYERRCWRERMHASKSGEVFIPPMQLKKSVETAAKFLSEKIPGKGKATFTKHFRAGVLCMDPVPIGVQKDQVDGESLFLDGNPNNAKGSRVMKVMPMIPEWSGVAVFHILDDTITTEVFERTLTEAGKFIGLGRFRPENGGFYGRFVVDNIDWEETA